MTHSRYDRELEIALAAVRRAGRLLLDEFYRAGGPRGKAGKCPADDEAEAYLRDRLDEAFPAYGQRGEELLDRNRPAQDEATHVWLIDPNDGTSAFQAGWRGAAVSLALLRAGEPVLGIVFAYAARAGRGDLFTWAEGLPLQRNGTVVEPAGRRAWEEATLLVSSWADRKPQANADYAAPARFRAVPSIAYRLALVAAGEAEATVSFSSPTDWDVAGGHALLRAVNLDLYREDGTPVRYRRDGTDPVGNCLAGEDSVVRTLAARTLRLPSRTDQAAAGDPYGLVMPDPQRQVHDPALLDRAQGLLLGQCAGDSLGAIVEFEDASRIRARFPDGPRQLIAGGTWGLLAGQPTDDSELALILARSILKAQRYDSELAASAYAWWLDSEPFDVGLTTRTALAAASAAKAARRPPGAAAAAAAHGSGSQANGALMRVSPLALFGHALPHDQLAELARQDARLTHSHPVCQDANAVYCVALGTAIRSGTDAEHVYRQTLDWARSQRIHPDVVTALVSAADVPPADYSTHPGWVLIALQNAFYQLLHARQVVDGLAATVLAGGDTDTNAAIAGALLGAVRGAESLPPQWLDRLLTCRPLEGIAGCQHPRPAAFWPVDVLILAEQLAWLGSKLP